MNRTPLSEADLQDWITSQVEESHIVEYKRAASLGLDSIKRAEIAKDVSAMANSSGGLLFYGIAETKHLPISLDPVVDPKLTREWLEQVISSGIHPRIPDLRIHPVRVTQPVNGVVYVVEVPEGGTAHQAVSESRYYRRYNFEAVPMHDREVRDVMGRNRDPIVDVTVSLNIAPAASALDYRVRAENEVYRWLSFGLRNVGTRRAHEVQVFAHIPFDLLDRPDKMIPIPRVLPTPHGDMAVIQFSNKLVDGEGPLAIPAKRTGSLLPGLSMKVTTIRLVGPRHAIPQDTRMTILVYADDAQVRKQVIDLHALKPKE